jgi:hypothetical protein
MTMTRFPITRLIALVGALLMCVALTAPLSALAAQPGAPFVYTGSYVGATAYAATFAGGINPRGLATVYAFQYGTTTGYGAQTAPISVGNGTTWVKEKQTIQGLQPATTYHVRLIATNSAGTTNGPDVTFTTQAIPLKLQVSARPNPVVFGNSFSVSGSLAGTAAAGHSVILQANPFPFGSVFKELSHPTTTNSSGQFSFPVASILRTTQLRVLAVGTQPVNSPMVVEQVAVRVSLHLSSTGKPGFMNMSGTVEPSEVGASVSFQLLRRGSPPLNVGWTKAGRLSRGVSNFSRKVRLRGSGMYRAEVHVYNGQQVSGYSQALRIG